METIQINSIEEKQGPKAKYWMLETNIGKFNIFDAETVESIKPHLGKWFNVEFEQKGKFKNLVAVIGLAESKASSMGSAMKEMEKELGVAQKPSTIHFVDKHSEAKERRIIRQSCLKAAVEIGGEHWEDYKAVLACAEVFEAWVMRPIEAEEE